MMRETVTEGPSIAEALDAALEEMGVQQDSVGYEVLEEPTSGMFGSGRPARVRVWLKEVPAPTAAEWDDEPAPAEDGLEIDVEEREAEALSDEDLDRVADTGAATIRSVLVTLGISGEIEEYEGDEGEIILDIVGDDLGLLIGRHGRTLDALQVLVSAITNRALPFRHPVIVDVSGYRHRRRLKLEEMARRGADRASRQRRPVQLRPMSSFERRVIHVALRDDRRVTTASEGEEPRRMVVIHPR